VKTIATTSALVAILALGSLSTGCSASPSNGKGGGNVNTGSAISGLRSPTGTFSKASASSAFAGYRSKRADSQHVSAPVPNAPSGAGGGASTASIRTVRLLDKAASSEACSAGQDCACPTGGTMAYQAEQTSDGQLVQVTFDGCGFEDGMKFDGEAVLLASTKSLLGAASDAPAKDASPPPSGDGSGLKEASDPGAAASGGIVSVLLAAQGTATQGGQTEAIDFALLTEEHYAFLAVTVADGSIVIGVGDDGNAVIHAKDATWKCKNAASGWACTSESGESLEVADDGAAASGEAPAPAASGSSSGGAGQGGGA